jgi:hypothetical protein
LLDAQLPIVSALEPGYAVALATQRPENVAFYERFGFRVEGDQVIGAGAAAFRSWTMVRPVAQ